MDLIKNCDVFYRDPTTYTIPNDGVAKVAPLKKDDESDWKVARYELENFVCKGSYYEGLKKILQSYLDHIDHASQPAVWVSGFFGCGKSHIVRVLDFLWRDITFSDGTTARNLCNLPDDINILIKELSTESKRNGGIWSAAGTMSAGSGKDPRIDLLQVVLRSADMPENINVAKVHLWLDEIGILNSMKEYLKSIGHERDLLRPFVSPKFTEALIKLHPDYSGDEDPENVKNDLRREFRASEGITNTEMVDMLNHIFLMQSENRDKIPLVLIILDEVQQYLTIGDGPEKLLDFQEAVEECCKRFNGKVLFVATGQEALQANTLLQKLQGRFSEKILLESKDVDVVLRQTILLKKESMKSELKFVMDSVNGEISRHLLNSKLSHRLDDDEFLVSDYPLLPSRKRFWERVMTSVDPDGMGNQLRTQLRLVFDGAKDYANFNLGNVIPADYIYTQIRKYLKQNYILSQKIDEMINKEDDGSENGKLRSRICATIFLIQHIDSSYGIVANPDTICDLMVSDLVSGSESLRQVVPGLLDDMYSRGILAHIGTEYHIQTEEGSAWEGDYQKKKAEYKANDSKIIYERNDFLKKSVQEKFEKIHLLQGESKTPRNIRVTYFGDERPKVEKYIPIWVRHGWDISEKAVFNECAAEGNDSPIVTVFIPLDFNDELRDEIAGFLAADKVIDRGAPTTPEGIQAKKNIETKLEKHESKIEKIVKNLLEKSRIILAGGTVVSSDNFVKGVEEAANKAMIRLYPRFNDGDATNWDKVINSVKKEESSPLSKIGFSKDPIEHPVCREILKRLDNEKRGNELRNALDEPPFGWPKEAVEAGILVLVASEHINARLNNKPVFSVDLDKRNIGNAVFEVEEVVLSSAEKMGAREMYLKLGLGLTGHSGKEVEEAILFLEKIKELARKTGGEAPLPFAESPLYLSELSGYSGNSLIKELNAARDEILADIKSWKTIISKIDSRMKEWNIFIKLLEHSEGLPDLNQYQTEADTILEERSILGDPDPVEPLLSDIRNDIRECLSKGAENVNKAKHWVVSDVESDGYCKELSTDKKDSILKEFRLDEEFYIVTGDDDQLIEQLRKTPLNSFNSKVQLIHSNLPQIKEKIAKMLVPETVLVNLDSPIIIKSKDELETYLSSIREQAKKALEEGNPVMLK